MAAKRKPARSRATRGVMQPPREGKATERRAEVVLDVECQNGVAHLVLSNTGDAVATDVRVGFSSVLHGVGGSVRISELALFKRLGLLRPGREFRVFWDATPRLFEKKSAPAFEATVTWRDGSGRENRARYQHDLEIFRELPETSPALRSMPPDSRPGVSPGDDTGVPRG